MGDLFADSLRPNVKVLEIAYLSPQIKKIRFQGDISKMNFEVGNSNIIRVSDTDYRNYTVAYHDKQNGIFDIIFHIHGNGVGSNYIDALKTNDEIYLSTPTGKKLYDQQVKQQFFFGYETSLGVAVALFPFLKSNKHQFQFYFELDEENKNVPKLLGLENSTVFFPKNNSFRNEKWLTDLPLFKTGEWNTANFALVGNVKSVQTFRKVLKDKTQGKVLFAKVIGWKGKKGCER
ncbi:MAG: FAD-binding oxidoreductase [Leadbetterella sp.]|nr:FAD-binding oxidoreductase [Leadbetterella sp.]